MVIISSISMDDGGYPGGRDFADCVCLLSLNPTGGFHRWLVMVTFRIGICYYLAPAMGA